MVTSKVKGAIDKSINLQLARMHGLAPTLCVPQGAPTFMFQSDSAAHFGRAASDGPYLPCASVHVAKQACRWILCASKWE